MEEEGNGNGGGGGRWGGRKEKSRSSGGKKWGRVKEKGEVEMSEGEVLRRGVEEGNKVGGREIK